MTIPHVVDRCVDADTSADYAANSVDPECKAGMACLFPGPVDHVVHGGDNRSRTKRRGRQLPGGRAGAADPLGRLPTTRTVGQKAPGGPLMKTVPAPLIKRE